MATSRLGSGDGDPALGAAFKHSHVCRVPAFSGDLLQAKWFATQHDQPELGHMSNHNSHSSVFEMAGSLFNFSGRAAHFFCILPVCRVLRGQLIVSVQPAGCQG